MTASTSAALQIFVLLLMTYVGLLVGASKGDLLNPTALGTLFSGDKPSRRSAKVLDTSVIIDGRIADIAEAGFIDGMMVVPEFVLRELQIVADSTDGSKRQRGRRGLDMLQRMQSNTNIQVQIVPDDFPSIREVDLKLLELAKKWEAKVVTNDFNLNKVAHLHRVEVLNINDLANALKPVVLPGEKMNVLILKEGKEYNQGVGYLDDGTMVVVDHARKMIGQAGGDLRHQRAADGQRQDDLRQDGRERQELRDGQGRAGGDRAISPQWSGSVIRGHFPNGVVKLRFRSRHPATGSTVLWKYPSPISVSKFLVFNGLRRGCVAKFLSPLDLAADSSQQRS